MGDGSEIFRINLEDGQFMAPLASSCPAINCLDIAAPTQLIVTGGDDGVVEVWDPRVRTVAARLDAWTAFGNEVTPVRVCDWKLIS